MWDDRENQARYMKWLMQYSKPYIGKIILVMLLGIASTVASLVMVQISKVIIDNASFGNAFVRLLVVYLLLMLLMQGISIVNTLVSTMLTERFSFGIRKQIYEKIIRSHWMSITKYHTGDLMTRLTSDAGNIADGIIGTIPNIIMLIVELVMVFFTLFYYSPLLAILALLVAPVAAIMAWWLGKKLRVLQKKVQETESAYRSFLQESMANLLVVKAFTNEDYSVNRLTDLRENRFYWVYKKTKMGVISSTAMSLAFQLGYIAAFSYGVYQIANGAITYGTMSVFLSLVNRVQSPVLELAQQVPRIVMILTSTGRIVELQNIPLEESSKKQIEAKKIGVKVENLSFGYTQEPVLKDTSLTIEPGEFVAIIGESGIGKTTLIRLIMSFMNTYQGSITYFNEKGETEPANAATREFVSYVPQGNTLFSGTIRENIRIGNLNATEEEIPGITDGEPQFYQKLDYPNSVTFVGSGKLQEIKEYVVENEIGLVIFDDELSAKQLRNIEKELQVKILDRTNLILDIFARRAQTAHAKTQVELAQYKYMLPRLTRLWTHLERQRGGVGMRGPGETQLETDKRIILDKISKLKRDLVEIDKQKSVQRKNRGKMVRVALVGYTNVGKSTLMNLLSKSEVFAENKLFATLDTTVRKVIVDNLPFLLSDTVGFIRKLPTELVESFKSTLDEVREADLLVHVVDISHPTFEEQIEVVNRTLSEIDKTEKPMIMVFNKIDAFTFVPKDEDDLTPRTRENIDLDELKRTWMNKMQDNCIFISAKERTNIDALKALLYERVKQIHITRFPYNDFLFQQYDEE